MGIGVWLRELGLERYETAFRSNDIDVDLLSDLTEADLERLGVASLGHRKKLLRAIEALRPPEPEVSAGATAIADTTDRRAIRWALRRATSRSMVTPCSPSEPRDVRCRSRPISAARSGLRSTLAPRKRA